MSIIKVIWIRRPGGWDAVLDGKVVGRVEDSRGEAWEWHAERAHGSSSQREAAFRAVAHIVTWERHTDG